MKKTYIIPTTTYMNVDEEAIIAASGIVTTTTMGFGEDAIEETEGQVKINDMVENWIFEETIVLE